MTTTIEARPESCWTEEYLLEHCEGYWVEAARGERVGVVDRVRCSIDGPEAQALVIRGLGGGELVVPVDRISDLRPGAEIIVVPNDLARELAAAEAAPSPRDVGLQRRRA